MRECGDRAWDTGRKKQAKRRAGDATAAGGSSGPGRQQQRLRDQAACRVYIWSSALVGDDHHGLRCECDKSGPLGAGGSSLSTAQCSSQGPLARNKRRSGDGSAWTRTRTGAKVGAWVRNETRKRNNKGGLPLRPQQVLDLTISSWRDGVAGSGRQG